MFPWPLLFASLTAYLPGQSDPVSGVCRSVRRLFGGVARRVIGVRLLVDVCAVLALVAHIVYGIRLSAVSNYFSTRPDSIV